MDETSAYRQKGRSITEKLKYYHSLSKVEKMVYEVVADGKADPKDVGKIAEYCNLPEMHVGVALHLLSAKNLIT